MQREVILTEYRAETRNFLRGAREYDRSLAVQQRLTNDRLNRIDQRWERSTRSILRTRTALVGLTGLTTGATLLQIRRYAEEWRNVERRLASIGETSDQAQQGLVDLALRTRGSLGGTAAAVQRFARSTGDDLETTTRRVETLQKLLAVNGASGAERSSVSLQLGQALQSGVLSGDEFRTIREAAPVEFLDALAAAAGVTRAELKATAEAQALTTDVVLQALDNLASTADARFSQLAVSGDEAIAVLTTGLAAYAGQVDESLGVTASINDAMVSLGERLSQGGEGAENLAASLRVVGSVALATAGSRGLGGLNNAFRQAAVSRREAVTVAQAQVRSSRQTITNIQQERDNIRLLVRERQTEHIRRVANDEAQKRSAQQLRNAKAQLRQVEERLNGAQIRSAAATDQLTQAQSRLNAAYRLGAVSARAFSSVLTFFGGPVGLAITAGTLLVSVLANMRAETDRLDASLAKLPGTLSRLEGVNSKLTSDYDALREAQERLAEATRNGGDAAVEAARRAVGAVNRRIEANEKLRQELAVLAQAELNAARAALGVIERQQEALARREFFGRGRNPTGTLDEYIESQRELALAALESGDAVEELTDLQQLLVGQTTEAQIAILGAEERLMTLSVAAGTASGELSKTADETERLTRETQKLATELGLVGEVGANSVRSGVREGSIPPGALDDLPETDADRAFERILENRRRRARRESTKPSGRSGASQLKDDFRDLSALQELLVEGGEKQLFVERALNLEREKLQALLPDLIALGLSREEAERLIGEQLDRTRESLDGVLTAEQERAKAFATGILQDVRAADSLADAIDRIRDRLLDLAFDSAFDAIAEQFAKAFAPAGGATGGGGIFGQVIGGIVGAFGGGGGVQAATGGLIRGPGTGTSDSIPARLSDGEFVVRASAVTPETLPFLDAINRGPTIPRFASGGLIGSGPTGSANGGFNIIVNNAPAGTTFDARQDSNGDLIMEMRRMVREEMDDSPMRPRFQRNLERVNGIKSRVRN